MENQESKKDKNQLPLKKQFHPSYWEDLISSNDSDSSPTMSNTSMAESPNKNPPIAETSNQKPTNPQTLDVNPSVSEEPNPEPTYHFSFVMKPVKILQNSFEALSDHKFNTRQEVVIQVGKNGCEFIVSTFDISTGAEGFGYLDLKATGLLGFQLKDDFRKAFSVKGISEMFKSAERFDTDSIFVYSVEGSNKLSFQWVSTVVGYGSFGHGFPFMIDLTEVDPGVEPFPSGITYGFEAVIRSSVLRKMSKKLLRQTTPPSETVEMTLRPAAISIGAGTTLHATTKVAPRQEYRISTEWQNWKSLESASNTVDKASVYLTMAPMDGLMMRFHLDQLGDLVYLHQANFESVQDLPFLGNFYSLN